jgi:hypothetical protein
MEIRKNSQVSFVDDGTELAHEHELSSEGSALETGGPNVLLKNKFRMCRRQCHSVP